MDVAVPMFLPGMLVEVCNRFSRTWSGGFEIVTVGPDGYRLRRLSDRYELPADFRSEEIRRAS